MGKTIRETMQEFTVNQALKYLEGNPEVPLVKDTTPQPTLTQYCKKATFG